MSKRRRRSRRRSRREAIQKWAVTGVLGVLVLAVVGMGYYAMVIVPGHDRARAEASATRASELPPVPMATVGPLPTTGPAAANAKACEGLRAQVAHYGVVLDNPAAPASVAVIGDSYTAGDALERRTGAWAYKVGGILAGIGSTGFAAGGYCGDAPYASRLDAVLARGPEVLIIQGGLNDTVEGSVKVQAAAVDLLGRAASVPRVVVVGPVNAPNRDSEAAIDRALASAASTAGREYVSALGWDDLEFGPDGVHLTEAGHARFASHIGEATGLAVSG